MIPSFLEYLTESSHVSAEEAETVIALAYDAKFCDQKDLEQIVVDKLDEYGLTHEDEIVNQHNPLLDKDKIYRYYASKKKEFDFIADRIHEFVQNNVMIEKLMKRYPLSDTWYSLGKYKTTNSPAKTDISTVDGQFRFTVKKFGNSQLTTGKFEGECKAMMFCAMKSVFGDKIPAGNFEKLFKMMLRPSYPPRDSYKSENALLNACLDESPEFRRAVLREALTGEWKFGVGSPAIPNYVLVWSDDMGRLEIEDKLIYTLDEYLDHLIDGHSGMHFSKKASGIGTVYTSFRIQII